MVTSVTNRVLCTGICGIGKMRVLWQAERTMPETLIKRLSEIVESLSATANPVERVYLLKEFRVLLDIADDVIFREFPVSN